MLGKLMKYCKLYIKSIAEVWKASKLLTLLLFILISLQAILPLFTITSIQVIVNNLSLKQFDLFSLLLPISCWAIAYAYTSLANPTIKNIEGILSDKLIEHVNVTMMRKSQQLLGIELFEDANFYNDLNFISEQASWRPINLVIFGSSIIQFSITFISLAILLISYSPWIALTTIFVILPNSYCSFKIQQEAFESMVVGSEDIREMQYYSDVLLSSEYAKEARIFNYFDFFINKYRHKYNISHQRIMKSRFKKMKYSLFFSLLNVIVSLMCMIWFVKEVLNGDLLVGSLVAFANSLLYMNESSGGLVEHTSMLYDTLLYMEKYFHFLKIEDKVQNKENAITCKDTFDAIHFANISFQYPNQQGPALSDITFSIKKGEKIAIVGENGSGKSTLVKLFCRFYKLQSGHIYFDDINFEDFDINSYRHEIAAVFQDFGKYDLTLQENIGLGNLEKINDEKYLSNVLKRVGLGAFYEKIKYNLHQMLGIKFENTVNLSGGEWQKLAIARALLANRKIVILDEPTASLDPRSEFEIYQRFLELVEDKTVFFITHRLSAVKMADKVLVLKDGKLNGFDTHEKLMNENEYYREMYEMQANSYK